MSVIADFVDGFYDGPHATPKEAGEGPIFLGIKNVTPEGRLDFSEIRHVSADDFPKWTRRVTPRKDDIVFSYEATLHRYAIIPEGFVGCLGRRMALMRPNKDKVDPKFLHYYLLSPAWRREAEASVINGATVDRIPLTKVPQFAVRFPSLTGQKRIAQVLAAYDDLIDNNRRRIGLLEEAARLLYREWFVQFRFPGHEHLKIVDGVPEGWERATLKDVSDLTWGDTRTTKSAYTREGYDAYSAAGLDGKLPRYDYDRDGIVLSAIGAQCGKTWLARGKWSCIKNTIRIFPLENIGLEFLYFATFGEAFWPRRGAAQPFISQGDARAKSILVPTKGLLSTFSGFACDALSQADILRRQSIELANARDLLLPRLMDGRLEV